tara:strand:+ start:17067 stop:17810 length:744 start_codon:yes stop_codon:yes gene_type:complete
MKLNFLSLLFFIFLIACNNEETTSFESLTIKNNLCEDCTTVVIEIPKAVGKTKLSETINTALQEEIIALLNFDEISHAQNINDAVDAFINDYEELNNKFPEESTPWEASIQGAIVFENKDILTIKLESYIFTGGAHGYGTNRFLNFEKINGNKLDQKDLFKNEDNFILLAESIFKEQENIPTNAEINSTGFMFETETFSLPNNIGYTENGLQLFYEPYEIASFADGPIIIFIPYNEANKHLNFSILP